MFVVVVFLLVFGMLMDGWMDDDDICLQSAI